MSTESSNVAVKPQTMETPRVIPFYRYDRKQKRFIAVLVQLPEVNKVDVLLGLQWGDEGKGKVVDALIKILMKYNIVARFQGGPNAGHTIKFGGRTFVFHNLPSGVTIPGVTNVIGDNVVINPYELMCEIEKLLEAGYNLKDALKIAMLANLITPMHRVLDMAMEKARGKGKIGTTGQGIGTCYADQTARKGLLVGYIGKTNYSYRKFRQKYNELKQEHLRVLASYGFKLDEFKLDGMTFNQYEKKWFKAIKYLRQFEFIDCSNFINKALDEGKKVLAEGAQGSMLDVKHGSVPFVTSSNVLASGVCMGLGIAPNQVGRVFGLVKAYATRVGKGPFHTELHDRISELLRKNGHEFGATTGRPRRCGWLDLVAVKKMIQLSGVTDLVLTKSDVMDYFKSVKVAIAYKYKGKFITDLPFEANTKKMTPVYKKFPGWGKGINENGTISENLELYIRFIEKYLGVPITLVSYGPDREQIIIREPFAVAA